MQPPSLPNLPRGVVEGLPSGSFFAEELGSVRIHRKHHQGAIQKIVVLLVRRFRDQQAPVTGCPVQVSLFMGILRFVLGANGIIRTELAAFQCGFEEVLDLPPRFNESNECALSARMQIPKRFGTGAGYTKIGRASWRERV